MFVSTCVSLLAQLSGQIVMQEVMLSGAELYQPQSGYALSDGADNSLSISEASLDAQADKDLSASKAQHSLHAADVKVLSLVIDRQWWSSA